MQSNRRISRVEVTLRRALWQSGLRGYRLQHKVPGRPDVAFPRHKIAIFVNGCFWHRCEKCNPPFPKRNREFWGEKFAENRHRDEHAYQGLAALGWLPLVIWECEIRRSVDGQVGHIREAIERRGHPPAGGSSEVGCRPR